MVGETIGASVGRIIVGDAVIGENVGSPPAGVGNVVGIIVGSRVGKKIGASVGRIIGGDAVIGENVGSVRKGFV